MNWGNLKDKLAVGFEMAAEHAGKGMEIAKDRAAKASQRFKENMPGRTFEVNGKQYRTKKMLGEGGFGYVYLVNEAVSNQVYALKQLIISTPDQLQQAKSEHRIWSSLSTHRNIVRLLDFAVTKGPQGETEVIFVMECCSGGGVYDLMNARAVAGQRFREEEIWNIFSSVCEAVSVLHNRAEPIAHRDLKVENVLIGNDGTYKLCDFGSATTRTYQPQNERDRVTVEADVQKNTTMEYRAPEMLDLYRRQLIDSKVDIWALGVMLYKLSFFESPFEEGSSLGILNENWRIPDNSRFSSKLHDMIKFLLVGDPSLRPDIFSVIHRVSEIRNTPAPSIQRVAPGTSSSTPTTPTTTTTNNNSSNNSNNNNNNSGGGDAFSNIAVNRGNKTSAKNLFDIVDWQDGSAPAPSSSSSHNNNNNSNSGGFKFDDDFEPRANNSSSQNKRANGNGNEFKFDDDDDEFVIVSPSSSSSRSSSNVTSPSTTHHHHTTTTTTNNSNNTTTRNLSSSSNNNNVQELRDNIARETLSITLNSSGGSMGSSSSSTTKDSSRRDAESKLRNVEQNEKHQKILRQLMQLPENRHCADCGMRDPTWASINLGVFICLTCSGIHRSLGVHISKVRSVNLDTWEPEQVLTMQAIGNAKAKAVYEARVPSDYPVPKNNDNHPPLRRWIQDKYERKSFISKDPAVLESIQVKPPQQQQQATTTTTSTQGSPAVSHSTVSAAPAPSLLDFDEPAPASSKNGNNDFFDAEFVGASSSSSKPTTTAAAASNNNSFDFFGSSAPATTAAKKSGNDDLFGNIEWQSHSSPSTGTFHAQPPAASNNNNNLFGLGNTTSSHGGYSAMGMTSSNNNNSYGSNSSSPMLSPTSPHSQPMMGGGYNNNNGYSSLNSQMGSMSLMGGYSSHSSSSSLGLGGLSSPLTATPVTSATSSPMTRPMGGPMGGSSAAPAHVAPVKSDPFADLMGGFKK